VAARWAKARPLKDALNIPMVANGDVFTASDVASIYRATAADSVMIARGAMWNPSVFLGASAALSACCCLSTLPRPPCVRVLLAVDNARCRTQEPRRTGKMYLGRCRSHYHFTTWYDLTSGLLVGWATTFRIQNTVS
jgi:tRNA-dihydrouridine synthase